MALALAGAASQLADWVGPCLCLIGGVQLCVRREAGILDLANVTEFVLIFAAIGDQGVCVAVSTRSGGAKKVRQSGWRFLKMSTPRKQMRGSRAFAVPLFGIVVLLALYWLLTEWHQVPEIIGSALAAVHYWPP